MIRATKKEGYWLISQAAHARISADLVKHWGNRKIGVTIPQPHNALFLATLMHDNGWLELDKQALLVDGKPMSFLEPDVNLFISNCERSVTYAQLVDRYAGILVNRHMQTIVNSRLNYRPDEAPHLTPFLDQLRTTEATNNQSLRGHPLYDDYLDEATLADNYNILRTCDLLSLFVCGGFPARPIHDVVFHKGTHQTLTCQLLDTHTLLVSPNIFAVPQIEIYVPARVIDGTQFDTLHDYSDIFNTAPFITLKKTIVGD